MDSPPPFFAEAPFTRGLGFEFVSAEPLKAVIAVDVRAEHAQAFGQTHGGLITTLLDTAAALACHATLGPGVWFTSSDFSVQLLRPAPIERLTASATVIHHGRTRLVVDAVAHRRDGKLCARYTGGFIILAGKPA